MGVHVEKEPNATCVVCGKKYHVCQTCEDMRTQINSWRLNCDTQDCFKVFMVFEQYKSGDITKEEAQSMLNICLAEEMKPYGVGVQRLLDEIYEGSKVKTEPTKPKTSLFSKKKTK